MGSGAAGMGFDLKGSVYRTGALAAGRPGRVLGLGQGRLAGPRGSLGLVVCNLCCLGKSAGEFWQGRCI